MAAGGKYEPHEREFLPTVERTRNYSSAKDIMLERVAPAQIEYQKAISTLSEYQVEQTGIDVRIRQHRHKATATAVLLGLAALARVAVGVAAAWLIIRGLVGQLRKTVDILERTCAQGQGRPHQAPLRRHPGRGRRENG